MFFFFSTASDPTRRVSMCCLPSFVCSVRFCWPGFYFVHMQARERFSLLPALMLQFCRSFKLFFFFTFQLVVQKFSQVLKSANWTSHWTRPITLTLIHSAVVTDDGPHCRQLERPLGSIGEDDVTPCFAKKQKLQIFTDVLIVFTALDEKSGKLFCSIS